MNDILEASRRENLWHQSRDSLAQFIPEIRNNNLLMCCVCGRFLPQAEFNLEHLIPRQALADDPPQVRQSTTANERSGNILLCKKPLTVRGKTAYSQGCNSWKGRFYDRCIRDFLNGSATRAPRRRFSESHNIAMVSLAYLAMVREYGFQIALTPSGHLLRRQFFMPQRFLREMPERSQMVLAAPPIPFNGENLRFWTNPFHFAIEDNYCVVTIKTVALAIPLSRDPRAPIAQHLPFAPSKFTLRPDFGTIFD